MTTPDTTALVAELRQVAARGGFSDDYAEIDLDPEDKRNLRAAADALEAQAARITELEAAVAERNSLIGYVPALWTAATAARPTTLHAHHQENP